MDVIKHWLGIAALIAAVWAFVVYVVPFTRRVSVPQDYTDLEGLKPYESYGLEVGVPPEALRPGDGICYRLGQDADKQACFGWIVAKPGDRVSVVGGALKVNGNDAAVKNPIANQPDSGPLQVPAGHVYVVSSYHRLDSVAFGPLPEAAIRGRLSELP